MLFKGGGFKAIKNRFDPYSTTLARHSVGFRLDMLDGPLGRTAESGQGMLEMLLLDFLGATITGQEVNLKYAVFNSLTSAMMSEVIHAVQADMPSMTPQAKEDKLKGGRNLPPHSKPESQRLGSSQKRYNEKQHQKAILASYGHLPAANDAFFKEPVKEFMSDMRHDMSLDFDAETGHLIFDPLESHLHSSHVRVSASSSGMHSNTTTGQHQQAREHHARARAVPGKPGDSFGGSGLGLFSRPASSTKPSGFMDYVDGVNSARDSTIGMLKQVVYHPFDTVSAPFIGAWHVAHHPKYSYHHAVQSTKDFTEHFAKASGAERLGIALGFVGSGIYGAAFGAGTLPVLGAAAKYGRPLVSGESVAVAGIFGRMNAPSTQQVRRISLISRFDSSKVGTDPEAIRVYLGLPNKPIYVSDVLVPEKTTLTMGRIGPQPNFGLDHVSGFQYQLSSQIPKSSFMNTRLIEEYSHSFSIGR